MLKLDIREIQQLERDLARVHKHGIPHAARAVLTSMAFDARKEWQVEIGERFVLRNKFTVQSIRVHKASGRSLADMKSVVGSVASYMAPQEEGGVTRTGNKYGPPVPTLEARSGKSNKRLVARPNKLANINLAASNLSRFSSRKQKIAVAASMAARSGSKFVMLPIRGSEGIYRLSGSARRPRMRMIWSMSKRTVRIPEKPTMQPSVQRVEGNVEGHWKKALVYQLSRAKSWKR